jgi:hypothetical protein
MSNMLQYEAYSSNNTILVTLVEISISSLTLDEL